MARGSPLEPGDVALEIAALDQLEAEEGKPRISPIS